MLVTPSSEAVVEKKSSVNKVSLEILKNSQENTCASLCFNKVAGIRPATLSKKEPLAQMSCCDLYYIYIILKWYFSKFLRTFFFTKHLWWLLLAVTFESIKLFTSAKHYESIFWIILSSFNFLIQPAVFEKCQLSGSNHQRCSIKTGVLRNFTKFTVKQLCQSLSFHKVAGLRPATLLKRDSDTGAFLWILWNF